MLEKSQVWGADSTGRLTEELGGLHTGLHCMDILSKPPGLEPGDTLVWQCHQQQDWKDSLHVMHISERAPALREGCQEIPIGND